MPGTKHLIHSCYGRGVWICSFTLFAKTAEKNSLEFSKLSWSLRPVYLYEVKKKKALIYLVLSILGKVVLITISHPSWQFEKITKMPKLKFLETKLPRNLTYKKLNVSHMCPGGEDSGKREGTKAPSTAKFNSSTPHY